MIAVAAVICWLVTVSIGAYMLYTWVARGGLQAQRTTGWAYRPLWCSATPPPLSAAWSSGPATWLPARSSWRGPGHAHHRRDRLGVCTVTLWTPYPVAVPDAIPKAVREPTPPAQEDAAAFEISDEMITRLLENPFPAARRPRPRLAASFRYARVRRAGHLHARYARCDKCDIRSDR